MSGITCLDKLETPLPCDVAEWCPNEGAQRVLAVGTYKLDEASQQRRGALHMFRLEGDGGGGRLLPLPAAGLPLPGVFDLRWQPRSAMPQLVAALADGSLRLLQWSGGEGGLSDGGAGAAPPAELAVLPGPPPGDGGDGGDGCGPSTAMAVSLDFTRALGGTAEKLVGSYSSGQLQLFQASPSGWLRAAAWRAHSLEAWAAAADGCHPHLLHSGGDDAAYCLWDERRGFGAPAWRDRRSHGAGVCCVAPSPHAPHLAATGSYDDRLRLWDLRAPARPLLAAQLEAGGGVWRAKWHPHRPDLLLTACMYAGFAVVAAQPAAAAAASRALTAAAAEDRNGGAGPPAAAEAAAAPALRVLCRYQHAEGSLSYGADWYRAGGGGGGGGGGCLAATASFYDRQLHLWSFSG